ncbi:hypothetical protein BIU89_05565 [Curtobacterium sp. MCBA15_005]|nr:hypothetical protein BIU89_05565 [Curtobacterium sp. MCBA15_005]
MPIAKTTIPRSSRSRDTIAERGVRRSTTAAATTSGTHTAASAASTCRTGEGMPPVRVTCPTIRVRITATPSATRMTMRSRCRRTLGSVVVWAGSERMGPP